MSFFTSLIVSGSALSAERLRVDLASANLANANSTRSTDGGPYRRRDPVLAAVPYQTHLGHELGQALRMVKVLAVVIDPRPPREIFDPSHPDAGADGIVRFPNISAIEESVNLLNASRAFQANVSAIEVSREMANRALRIGRG